MSSIRESADIVIVTATTFCVCDAPSCVSKREGLRNAIEQALRNERERCAKIVNGARSEGADLRELVARIRDENYEVEP